MHAAMQHDAVAALRARFERLQQGDAGSGAAISELLHAPGGCVQLALSLVREELLWSLALLVSQCR